MTKNKLAYSLSYGSSYSCKRSFLSALVCVGLWLKIIGVFSVHSAVSSDPCQAEGERARENVLAFILLAELS
jgi:hypothetical protein